MANSGVIFGTSGARGLVEDFTADVCAAFTHSFVSAMKREFTFNQVALAIDNRPSSHAMAMACAKALIQQDIEPVFYGVIPTPALAFTAMQAHIPCVMITGSHIPFDRNGLKFYRPDGEISKADEQAIIQEQVEFQPITKLPDLAVNQLAAQAYLERYASLFSSDFLAGKKIGVYEHSSAGRDIYCQLFKELGAEVIALERSDLFVPIDTEAVSEDDQAKAKAWADEYGFDAIFSTDGDGDRPLIADEKGEWLRGDILGLLCANALKADALAIPVSCNTGVELCRYFNHVERTKIGSPYVIAEFEPLAKKYSTVVGFEANGGFLLGTNTKVNGKVITALPTRDAMLPALMLLSAAKNQPISKLVKALPQRVTYSDRIKDFPTARSQEILAWATPQPQKLLEKLAIDGDVDHIDITDGLRITLAGGNVVHLRPSGNAPELRCYAESQSADVAKSLVNQSLSKIQTIEI